jgi:phage gp36-like protein
MSTPLILSTTGGEITGTLNGVNRVFTTSIDASTAAFFEVYVDSGRDFGAAWAGTTLTTSVPPNDSVRIEAFNVSVSLGGLSYSTPAKLAKRMKPRIYAGLTGDGVVPDDNVAQGFLDSASRDINMKIGTRYVAPVTGPPERIADLANIEEQIAHWLLYVAAGFSEQDTAAAAAYKGYQNAMATLAMIAKSDLDLPGAALRDDGSDDDTASGFIMGSETPHYNPPDDGGFA